MESIEQLTKQAKAKIITECLGKEVSENQIKALSTGVDWRINLRALGDLIDEGRAVKLPTGEYKIS